MQPHILDGLYHVQSSFDAAHRMIRSRLPVVAFELRNTVVAITEQLHAQAMIILCGTENNVNEIMQWSRKLTSAMRSKRAKRSFRILTNCWADVLLASSVKPCESDFNFNYSNSFRTHHAYLYICKQYAHIVHGINVELVELRLHSRIRALVHLAAYLIIHNVGQNCKRNGYTNYKFNSSIVVYMEIGIQVTLLACSPSATQTN